MKLEHSRFSRRVLGIATLATVATATSVAINPAAHAATGTGTRTGTAATSIASAPSTAGPAPQSALAKHITARRTFTVQPGTTVTAGSARISLGLAGTARTARPAYAPNVTCTLTVYGPYVDEPFYPANVVVAAAINCDSPVSALSVTVGLYDGVTGNLLSDNSYVNDDHPDIATVQDAYPITANGYYIGGAIGYVGDPIDSSFPQEVFTPDTYVEPVP